MYISKFALFQFDSEHHYNIHKKLTSYYQIINELYFSIFCWQVSASKSDMIMGKLSTIKVVRRSVTKVNDSKTFLLSNLRRKFLTACGYPGFSYKSMIFFSHNLMIIKTQFQ